MKSLQILSSPDEIRFIGNEHAYAMLNLLSKKEYSGSGIASVMGMKASRAVYYLRKLEKLNLAEIVRTEQRRGTVEKFFRATAEHYIVYANVGKTDDDISLSVSNAYLSKLQYNSMEQTISDVLDTIVHDLLNIQEDDRVRIVFYEEAMEFMTPLIIRLRHIGAEYRTTLISDTLTRDLWYSMPISRVERFYNQMSDDIAWSNVWINTILHGSTTLDLQNIPRERIERVSKIRSNGLSGLYTEGRRNLLLYMPLFGKEFFSDPQILDRLRMYWNAASLKKSDYSRMKTISDYLLNTDSITIRTGQHHELDVRFDRNSYCLEAGPFTKMCQPHNTYHIPAGELAIVPMENGITGDIICEISAGISDSISGIRLKIENNIVVDAKAEEGQELLSSLLERYGVLGRTVSQVCFGLNKEMKSAELLPIIGRKLCGSISIAFGNNIHLGGNITDPHAWYVISVSPEVRSGKELILSNNEYHYQ